MEERKLWELQIDWKEMTNGSPGLGLVLELGETSANLRIKNATKLQVAQILPTDIVKISLVLNKKVHGSTSQPIGTLFGGKLQGKVEKWLNIKGKDNKIIKIRLGLGLTKPQNKKPQSSPMKRRPSRPRQIKCPYLQSLASGKEDNKEPLQNLWKIRDFSMNPQQTNKLKISLEPSSPARDRADQEFTVPSLEQINIPLLSTLSGSQLKQIVVYLCGQAQELHMVSNQLPEMRKVLQEKIQERRDLQTDSESQTQSMKKVSGEKDVKLQELLGKRKELATELNAARQRLRARQLDLDGLKAQRGDLLRQNILLQANALKNNDSYLLEKNLTALAQESTIKRRSLEHNLKKATEELTASHKEAVAQNQKLQQQSDEIRKELEQVSNKLRVVQDRNYRLQAQVADSKARLSTENLREKVKTAQNSYQGLSKKRHEIIQNFSQLGQEMVKADKQFLESDQKMIAERIQQNSQLVQLQNSDKQVQEQINQLKRSLLEASNQQITLEQVCCIRADLNELMSDMSDFQTVRKKVRSDALQSLEIGSKLLVAECEKTYNQASKLESIVDSVDNKDIELDGLKDQMDQAKKRNPPYVSVLTDPVDVALGDYLNSRHQPLEVNFIREEAGKYAFGSRKVHIRLENARVLLLKAGAQYVPVEEFLDMYYQKELEKQRMPSVSLISAIAPQTKTKQAVSSFAQAFLKLGDPSSPTKKTSPVKKKQKLFQVLAN